MPRKFTSLIGLLILFVAVVSYAQPEKDVVGTWKMDSSRSAFAGSRGAPSAVTIRFERQNGLLRETISVVNSAGETTRAVNYALDGTETVNGAGDEGIKTRVLRRGDEIMLEWIDAGGTFVRTLKLSNDRQVMSIKTQDTNPDGQKGDLIVLRRQ